MAKGTNEIKRILFFGDSICTGEHISLHHGWISQISRYFGEKAIVACAAVNGRTTREALERETFDLSHFYPHIMLIQFGMNDCNCWQTDMGLPRVSPLSFRGNIGEMIDRAFSYGVMTVFLNTNHPTLRTTEKMENTDFTYQENNHFYNTIITDVAKMYDSEQVIVNHIDKVFETVYAHRGDLVLPDGIHLSKQGHDLYYSYICPRIESRMKAR